MRTQVAIIGAGPAGMLLSHLLAADSVDSVIVEARTEDYVLARIRAGILEHASVELLRSVGLGDRLAQNGIEHRGIYLQTPGDRHHLDFVDLVGRNVWVYGQTEVQRDDVALHDVTSDRPHVTFTVDGVAQRLEADVIAGCDGSFGPSRAATPETVRRVWEKTYPYSWLGVLVDVAPSTDELIYAWHPNGFAMHSMRSDTVSRFYLQVPNGTDVKTWSDQRIWDALSTGLGAGMDDCVFTAGPTTESSVLPMRSYVQTPMRHGQLFLAGDAAHIVPPTGAKGLNLAIADVSLLASALTALIKKHEPGLADAYSEAALQRVWRCTHFSWWMTSMLHISGDPFDAELQRSQLRWVFNSRAAAMGLAENYAGLPLSVG